jgi:SAM-dependent methyltransferase
MMEWEKPYMRACVKAMAPRGDVLEVGFGCGYASEAIQEYEPKSHTIIEYHPVVAKKAREWAKGKKNIHIVEDTWQNALGKLGKFDAIFFDDYPLESNAEMKEQEKKLEQGEEVLKKGKAVIDEAHEKLPHLKTMQYTLADIDQFLSTIDREEKPEAAHFLRFLQDLKTNNQIEESTHQLALERLIANKLVTQEDIARYQESISKKKVFQHQGDRLFTFLDLCLKNHMREGAVFSCFFEDPSSKYFDQKFMDHVITNPNVEYHEEWIPITVPEYCNYYEHDQALVIRIQLMKAP